MLLFVLHELDILRYAVHTPYLQWSASNFCCMLHLSPFLLLTCARSTVHALYALPSSVSAPRVIKIA